MFLGYETNPLQLSPLNCLVALAPESQKDRQTNTCLFRQVSCVRALRRMISPEVLMHQRKLNTPKLEVVPQSPMSVGRADTHGNVVYNRILLALPDDEYDALLPHLEFVE